MESLYFTVTVLLVGFILLVGTLVKILRDLTRVYSDMAVIFGALSHMEERISKLEKVDKS